MVGNLVKNTHLTEYKDTIEGIYLTLEKHYN